MILRHKIYPKNYVNLLHSISHHWQKYQHIPRPISALFADIGNGASEYRKPDSIKNLSAVANPMPRLPPVMIATLSFNLI